MSLSVIADGRVGFQLHREGEQVGWIEGRAIGFRGFESAKDAHQAASTAYGALRSWLARQRRTDLTPGSRRTVLHARRDHGVTWLTLGNVRIGRLIEPYHRDLISEGRYGFELDLPPLLQPVNAISAAQVIDAALARRAEARRLESLQAMSPESYAIG
jgi:hypothetical protein